MNLHPCFNFSIITLRSCLLLLLLLFVPRVFTATVFSSSLKTCQSQCEDRNLAYPLHAGQLKWNEAELRAHNYTESIGSCRHGCEDVDERESKCAEKCSEDLVVTSSCQQGCRAVLVAFLTQAQAVLIEARVNMEVHDTGMKLKWEFPENVAESLKELATADIFWFAQTRPLNGNIGWRWTSLTQGAFRNSTLSTDVTVPFEEAQNVEVRLAMSYRSQVLVSRTTQYDLPLSKSGTHLEIVGQLQLSDDRVAICYKTNQPTPKFKLTVATLDGITLNTEESIARCHMFSNLPSDNCCRASIAAIDENGIITASREIVLDFFVNKVETELISSTATKLIFTNGTHLIEMNQGMVSEIITFPLPTDDKITAIAGITENTLAIGSEKGSLWTFQMNTNQTNEENIDEEKEDLNGENLSAVIQLKTVGEMDTKITQIEVDHVQRMIYAVQHDKGILRCKMRTLQTDESSSCVLIVNNDPLNPPKEISLDPINGFIYILNSDAKVYRTEMIALNSSTGIETPENFELMKELSPSNGIFYDWQKFFLYSSLQNGTVLSMNPINEHVHLFRDGDLANFRIKGDKIYWSRTKCGESAADSVCIFVENVQRGEDDLPNKFAYESALLDYTFLEEIFIKPRIASIGAISMLVSDRAAKIAWSRLSNLPFQAKGLSWRNTTYLLKITSTDQEPIELYLDTNEYTVGVKADTSYSVQVQACSEDFCSTPIRTENTAMSDFGEIIPYVLTKSHEDGIEVFDGLGNQVEVDETIRNLDKMSYPHAFDNSTKTVYLAGDHSMGIYKQDLNDVTKPPVVFKDGLFVEMMTIMPSKSMIIIGSSYKITSYRLPTTFDYEYYSCEEPLEDCAEVMGISSDDTSGMLFFITQHRNGTVTMWESNLAGETRSAKIISSSESIRPFRKFLVVQNKIIMVTKSGHIIQTDKNLNQMNEWVEGPRVDKIVPIRYAQQVRKVEFVDDIKIVDGSKTDLVWTITPASEPGDVIFKVSIYREKMGLDTTPIMSMQTETNYTIQQSVLDVWSSAQRFDVSVTAITPWLTVTQNKTGLLAPVKPPTAPVQLRIYATQQKTVDGPRALISFFWSPPVEWNGTPFQYVVNCTKDDGSWIGGPVTTSLTHYSFAVKSGKVSCQVAAANEPTNQGQFSDIISIDSSEIKPLVKLFAIDATNSLVSINDLAHEETTRETREVALPAKLDYQALAFIGEDLYAVRKEGDSAQPVLVKIDTNHYENTVHKVSIGGDVTRIDAMTSDWVGHRLLFVAGTVLYQLPLEPFLSTSLLNPHKIMQISSAATDAKQLTYDPFKNTAYLLTKNGSLFALDLNKKTEANLALTISCLAAQTITWMQTEFTWNRASSPKIYALTWNGLLYVDLAEDYQCNEVRIDWTKFGEKGIKAISSFAISDTLFAFVTSSEMLIYGRDMVTPIPITNPPLKQILAVSQSSQPYPDRSCFELPSSKGIVFTIVNEGKTGAFLEVTKSTVSSACSDVSMPQTQYEIYFTRKNTDKVKHIRSFSDKIHIENAILDKETDYDVTVTWLNRYSPASGVSPTKSFRTGFGYPSAPRDPHAIAVSPDTVYLYWMLPETLNAPISEIKYKISQQAAGLTSPTSIAVIPLSEVVATSNISSDTAACLINPCRVKIANLRPSNEYKFWVTATHISHLYSTFLKDDEAVSMESTARTLDVPGTLRPDNVTGSSIVLRWNGLEPETLPSSLNIQYRDVGHDWEVPMNTSFEPGVATEIIPINNLLSATTYDYRFVATYTGTYSIDGKVLAYKEEYFQLTQQVRTKAGVPTIPQNVESRIDEEGWIVTWKEPISDGGSPITSYAVETRHNKTAEWEIAERGLDGWKTWWRPGKSETSQVNDLEFRIRAANIEGFGAYAYTEERKEIAEEEKSVILPYFLFVLIVLLVIALLFVLWFWLKTRRAQFVKKREAQDERNCISLDVVTNLTFSPMQPMPPDIKNELKNLPHVNKEDVIIGNVIANGAYGRVHEGIASETPLSWEKNVKVAIKTLKHNYTYQERVMFMREAILLNNVDHPNIVKELGVCLSQGSEFLLLQFMEGGNLLDYLRQSIPTENQASDLCLRDLLAIAVDVARGMNYLEKLPHVHKDLSASRCLLASKSGPTKLSMGVYSVDTKSDFENTDKIRWMAPETLKDVQFTSKSDVWAFGVLLYEIFSLGELPYGEKENRRIVTDVKNGFILTRPTYCPEKLYKLMQQCWAFDQTKRPNFATILQIFESFRDRLEFQNDKPLQMHDGHYYNVNFDVSHDSTSSERGGADSREPPSPSHLSKSFSEFDSHGYGERNTFGSMVNARKSAKSLRREKAKSRNSQLLSDDFDSNRLQRTLSVHSADTISTEFSGERGLNSPSSSGNQYLSPYDAVKSRMSAAPALGIVNNAFESSNPPSLNLSRSWTAPSENPPNGNSMDLLRTNRNRNNAASDVAPTSPSYEQSIRNRVSQV